MRSFSRHRLVGSSSWLLVGAPLLPAFQSSQQLRFTGGKAVPPPPPPPPVPNVGGSGKGPAPPRGPSPPAKGFHTPPEVLEALIPYMPSFFVDADTVLREVPTELHAMMGSMRFPAYLRKYRFYFDVRVHHGMAEVKLRDNLVHPRRGLADRLYSVGLSTADVNEALNPAAAATPAGQRHQPIVSVVFVKCPAHWKELGEWLSDVSKAVTAHPLFDRELGIMGILERHPQYFQVLDGQVRRRPAAVAPNSIDGLDSASSPLPDVLKRCDTLLDEGGGKADTASLFSALSLQEKQAVKRQSRSFPRFLRQHGAILVVSSDNLTVSRFVPDEHPHEPPVVATSGGGSEQKAATSGRGAITEAAQVPETMDADALAAEEWAVKELYDALPVMQSVELDDVRHIVPDAVRTALPADLEAVLRRHPQYFTVWEYPDDTSIIVVQRGQLSVPEMDDAALIAAVLPLLPQGGMSTDKLLRRVPLPVQRHLYKYGVKARLGALTSHFLVAANKVMAVA